MIRKRRRMEVTIKRKNGSEEYTFTSIRKASEYMGISATQLSRIIRGTRSNTTGYFITTD